MVHEWFSQCPLWLFLLAVVGLFWGGIELGYRIGIWRHHLVPGERDQPVGAMVASILGLLALVLGFTFSLAAARFEARRQVVLEEANAVGTTYLRARILPEPHRTAIEDRLREYVAVRLATPGHPERLTESLAKSDQLQEEIWQHAIKLSEENPTSITVGLFVQSLNNLIDVGAKRVLIGVRSQIPWVIWFVLLALSIVSMASVGYQAGLTTTKRSPAMVALAMTFALVVFLVADLDRAHQGLLRVSQQAMLDVQKSIQATR